MRGVLLLEGDPDVLAAKERYPEKPFSRLASLKLPDGLGLRASGAPLPR